MDGRGRYLSYRDIAAPYPVGRRINIFVERLWRSLKQDAIYLHEITDGCVAKPVIDEWIGFCNTERPHTALEKRPPDTAYFSQTETRKAA